MIKGAIFDLDGTIMDSMHIWETFGTDYLKTLGIDADDSVNTTVRRMSLEQGADFLKSGFGIELSENEIEDGISRMVYDEYSRQVKTKPGVTEYLAYLEKNGVKMCIATATDIDSVEAALKNNGILEYFGKIFTCSMVGKGKDSPEIYEAALEFLGTDKQDTVVFEDAYHCVKTAKSAGFRVIGIYDRYEPEAEKTKSLCDDFAQDYTDIYRIKL